MGDVPSTWADELLDVVDEHDQVIGQAVRGVLGSHARSAVAAIGVVID